MLDKAAELIKKSNHIVVLTGAGISTDSGLPDYRSNGGLWDGKKPEEISHFSAVGKPEFVKFFADRMNDISNCKPNKAHEILAKWEEQGKIKAVITQNIDSYHKDAGSKNVIEMHGHLRNLVCDTCSKEYDNSMYTKEGKDNCGLEWECTGVVRPEVVLFGETLPPLAWHEANEQMQKTDLVIVLGTSLQVFPFNSLVESVYPGKAPVMIITKSDTPYDHMASVRIYDNITETLVEIDNRLK